MDPTVLGHGALTPHTLSDPLKELFVVVNDLLLETSTEPPDPSSMAFALQNPSPAGPEIKAGRSSQKRADATPIRKLISAQSPREGAAPP